MQSVCSRSSLLAYREYSAYSLAAAVGLLVGGRLGDVFGRKRMLLVGMAGFVALSIACAAAATPAELIVARAAQGAAGALMLPQVFGLIRDLLASRAHLEELAGNDIAAGASYRDAARRALSSPERRYVSRQAARLRAD